MIPTFDAPSVIAMQYLFVGSLCISLVSLFFFSRRSSPYTLIVLLFVVLTCHQVEEYLIAPLLLGDQYHFLN